MVANVTLAAIETGFWDEFVLPLGEIETESVLQLRLMMIIWLSLAVSLGIPGNLMVIFSIALVRHLRELHHLFVANLALFDLGNMGMFCFMLYGAIFGGEFLATHRVICELSAILCMMSCFGSLWTMMFVAINRLIEFQS
ncbi:leukotriene B4 receptor 1-like [Symsagittifera roscoffensis]|uniref:leukotriene B4 receptor 1-like n=1 Tax=Symsagittifera roscoffensis TaxID=84072 RepID=UPI00307B42F7